MAWSNQHTNTKGHRNPNDRHVPNDGTRGRWNAAGGGLTHRQRNPNMEGRCRCRRRIRGRDDRGQGAGDQARRGPSGSLRPQGRLSPPDYVPSDGQANVPHVSATTADGQTRESLTWAWNAVQRRIAREPGLSVVSSGRLAQDYAGHSIGAPYLVIRADCSLERLRASELLHDLAGVTELMWERGWTAQSLPGRGVATDLRIFPGQRPSPLGVAA
jgi:hypothetical protein